MSEKTRAELKEQIKIMKHNYQTIKEMHERGYQYSVGEIKRLQAELECTHKVLDKSMEHITGLNNMIESWYKLLQSDIDDIDTETKYKILKSAISIYVENKGGNNG